MMDQFSQRLIEQREKRKLTQNEMAEILAIAVTAYQHYEYGKVKPKLETLIAIANFFELSTDYLMGISNCDRPNKLPFSHDIRVSISKTLKVERARRGLTQKQMAQQLGFGYTTYQQYENGKRTPVYENILVMIQYFNLELDAFLGRKK